jgi:hypothetical protein
MFNNAKNHVNIASTKLKTATNAITQQTIDVITFDTLIAPCAVISNTLEYSLQI